MANKGTNFTVKSYMSSLTDQQLLILFVLSVLGTTPSSNIEKVTNIVDSSIRSTLKKFVDEKIANCEKSLRGHKASIYFLNKEIAKEEIIKLQRIVGL